LIIHVPCDQNSYSLSLTEKGKNNFNFATKPTIHPRYSCSQKCSYIYIKHMLHSTSDSPHHSKFDFPKPKSVWLWTITCTIKVCLNMYILDSAEWRPRLVGVANWNQFFKYLQNMFVYCVVSSPHEKSLIFFWAMYVWGKLKKSSHFFKNNMWFLKKKSYGFQFAKHHKQDIVDIIKSNLKGGVKVEQKRHMDLLLLSEWRSEAGCRRHQTGHMIGPGKKLSTLLCSHCITLCSTFDYYYYIVCAERGKFTHPQVEDMQWQRRCPVINSKRCAQTKRKLCKTIECIPSMKIWNILHYHETKIFSIILNNFVLVCTQDIYKWLQQELQTKKAVHILP